MLLLKTADGYELDKKNCCSCGPQMWRTRLSASESPVISIKLCSDIEINPDFSPFEIPEMFGVRKLDKK